MNSTEKTLTMICTYLNNWFWRSKINGDFTIENGAISEIAGLQNDQYFRIVGSVFNDGVHQYPTEDLKDEEFRGTIWSMAVPQDIIDLASDINDWMEKYNSVDSDNMSPYTSESFNGYSYSKSAGVDASGKNANSWQNIFADRLNPYRRTRGAS